MAKHGESADWRSDHDGPSWHLVVADVPTLTIEEDGAGSRLVTVPLNAEMDDVLNAARITSPEVVIAWAGRSGFLRELQHRLYELPGQHKATTTRAQKVLIFLAFKTSILVLLLVLSEFGVL